MILMIQGSGSVRYNCGFSSGMPVSSITHFKAVGTAKLARRGLLEIGLGKLLPVPGGLLSKVVGLREEPTWLSTGAPSKWPNLRSCFLKGETGIPERSF